MTINASIAIMFLLLRSIEPLPLSPVINENLLKTVAKFGQIVEPEHLMDGCETEQETRSPRHSPQHTLNGRETKQHSNKMNLIIGTSNDDETENKRKRSVNDEDTDYYAEPVRDERELNEIREMLDEMGQVFEKKMKQSCRLKKRHKHSIKHKANKAYCSEDCSTTEECPAECTETDEAETATDDLSQYLNVINEQTTEETSEAAECCETEKSCCDKEKDKDY